MLKYLGGSVLTSTTVFEKHKKNPRWTDGWVER